MNYLCMAVQKEVVKGRRFDSRESAEECFWQRFGGFLEEELAEEKRKLERRIRYYERRAEKGRECQEGAKAWDIRREAALNELERINRQLRDESGAYRIYYYEENQDIPEQPGSWEAELVFHLAGLLRIGGDYQITEEKYCCTLSRVASEGGILEVRQAIPEAMLTNNISLDICQESPQAAGQWKKKVKKMEIQARKEFGSRIERSRRGNGSS